MGRSNPVRRPRNVAFAVAASLAVQFLAFVAIVGGFRDRPPPREFQAIEVTMLRPPGPPTEPKPVAPRREPAARLAPSVRRSNAPPAWTAPPGEGQGPAAAGLGPPQAPPPLDLNVGCLGKHLFRPKGEERYRCEQEVRTLVGRPSRQLEAVMDPEKKAAYDAVAARQADRRAPVSRLGNGASIGCAQSNLGVACSDDMVIPLMKRKF